MKYNMYVAAGKFNENLPSRWPVEFITQIYPTHGGAVKAAKDVMEQGYHDLEGYTIKTVTIEVS